MITISKTARLSALLTIAMTGLSAFAMEDMPYERKAQQEKTYPKEVAAILTDAYTPNNASATTKQLHTAIKDIQTNCITPLKWGLESGNYNDRKVQAAMDLCNSQIDAIKTAIASIENTKNK